MIISGFFFCLISAQSTTCLYTIMGDCWIIVFSVNAVNGHSLISIAVLVVHTLLTARVIETASGALPILLRQHWARVGATILSSGGVMGWQQLVYTCNGKWRREDALHWSYFASCNSNQWRQHHALLLKQMNIAVATITITSTSTHHMIILSPITCFI